jgi:hypothetical protein
MSGGYPLRLGFGLWVSGRTPSFLILKTESRAVPMGSFLANVTKSLETTATLGREIAQRSNSPEARMPRCGTTELDRDFRKGFLEPVILKPLNISLITARIVAKGFTVLVNGQAVDPRIQPSKCLGRRFPTIFSLSISRRHRNISPKPKQPSQQLGPY